MSADAMSPVLPDLLRIPDDFRSGAPLIVLLHGRGADKDDLASLSEFLPEGAAAAFPGRPFRLLPGVTVPATPGIVFWAAPRRNRRVSRKDRRHSTAI